MVRGETTSSRPSRRAARPFLRAARWWRSSPLALFGAWPRGCCREGGAPGRGEPRSFCLAGGVLRRRGELRALGLAAARTGSGPGGRRRGAAGRRRCVHALPAAPAGRRRRLGHRRSTGGRSAWSPRRRPSTARRARPRRRPRAPRRAPRLLALAALGLLALVRGGLRRARTGSARALVTNRQAYALHRAGHRRDDAAGLLPVLLRHHAVASPTRTSTTPTSRSRSCGSASATTAPSSATSASCKHGERTAAGSSTT